jgi:hypothetical protein
MSVKVAVSSGSLTTKRLGISDVHNRLPSYSYFDNHSIYVSVKEKNGN